MKIIGGEYKGRRLKAPAEGTRPTSGRVREALFNIVDAADLAVLDLFAGTGAIGLEALSRGASHVTFVEQRRTALRVLRENIAALGAHNRTTLVGKEALATLKQLSASGQSFDLIFADPPYGQLLGQTTLDHIDGTHLLNDEGDLFIEESGRAPPLEAQNLTLLAARRYGETTLYHYAY